MAEGTDVDTRTQRNFEDIQHTHIGRAFGRLVHVRFKMATAVSVVAVCVALLDPRPWRIAWAGGMVVAALTFAVYEALRFKREGFTRYSVPLNIWVLILLQLSMLLGTGGIASPLLPAFVTLSFPASFITRGKRRFWLPLAQVASLALLAGLQLSGHLSWLVLPILGSAPPVVLATGVVLMCLLFLGATAMAALLRHTFDDMLGDALAHRDELLATHRAHARELESLSGEIAHELKNPLATVKGLTQLMAREPGRAQPTERLAVLSSEVSRMQGILEEFLNFSRPLVPLTVSTVDLVALCGEALVLHEGLAGERGVRLERQGEAAVLAVCDPRKVKQTLMNLLHNAIEASPQGGRVTVEVTATAAGDARVAVGDEGPGVPPELAARVFEAGVTTKARGSGLGLTVARALARQHGGDVMLTSGPRGGCVAELVLPRELPEGTLGPVREVAHA
ncbi:HAMP domain-containing sensor histidine kinase [Myxococcaceae bacterium GXIMD 01537]